MMTTSKSLGSIEKVSIECMIVKDPIRPVATIGMIRAIVKQVTKSETYG
jgi:hypothetical protein